jgi:hypothetical protein
VADCESDKPRKDQSRLSVFWSVCGGTILSITAMIGVTLYQQFSSNLNDIRAAVDRLNEARADLVKGEDLNTRMTAIWGVLKDLQSGAAAIPPLKEQTALLEQRAKTADTAQATMAALQERCSLLEQQIKAADEERKGLLQQLHALGERQAALEGRLSPSTAQSREPPLR